MACASPEPPGLGGYAPPSRSAPRRTSVVAVLGIGSAAAYSLAAAVFVLSRGPRSRVQFIPDDAFYYLTLARNFVRLRVWTADQGVSVTTGFHLLHAYALVVLFKILHPGPETCVTLGVLLAIAALLPAWIAAGAFVLRQRAAGPTLVLLLLGWSQNVAMNTVSGMEWGWVVSAAACYSVAWVRPPRAHGPALLFGLGVLGSLARSDFGVFPASLAAASVLLFVARLPGAAGDVRRAGAGLLGAVAGFLVVTGHTYAVTGHSLQSSARMKVLWLGSAWPSLRPIAAKIVRLAGPSDPFTWIVLVTVIALVIALGAERLSTIRRGDVSQVRLTILWIGAITALAGSAIAYAFIRFAVQSWYTANMIVPLFLLLVVPLLGASRRALRVTTEALLAVLIVREVVHARDFFTPREMSHQVSMYDAGTFLGREPVSGRVGSWNAGIIGFYAGGSVVNLDGLVNDSVYDYVAAHAVPEYVEKTGIAFIVDFQGVLTSEEYRKRGGYDSPAFLARLQPLRRFDDRHDVWSQMTLYRVRPMGPATSRAAR